MAKNEDSTPQAAAPEGAARSSAPWSLHRDPKVGDTVHIVGHGPASVLSVADSSKFKVTYPNGDVAVVDRQDVLVHEPPGKVDPAGAGPKQTGPRRLEYFGRAFDDANRIIATPSATFSLVATMVGGGVLSLPYAMSQCGLVLGTAVMFFSAVTSAWTMDMLVSCARCTGRDTFELIGHAAFGEGCRKLTVALVVVLTWLAQVGYFVLVQDLLSPTAMLLAPGVFGGMGDDVVRKLVVTGAAVLLAPMCYKGSLSALRFLCFASVGSVLLVGVILAVKAVSTIGVAHQIELMNPDKSRRSLELVVRVSLWPQSLSQALYVFPTFGVSFLCHFNALPTHQELQRPTRQRMQRVFKLAMCFTTLLYLFVALSGYAWAGNCTCGNILLNFAHNDLMVAVGRVALGFVLMLNFPLIVQPCRNALFRLLGAMCGVTPEIPEAAPEVELAGRSPSPSPGCSTVQVHAYRREDARGMMQDGANIDAVDTFQPKDEIVRQSAGEPTPAQRYILTTAILISSLLLSMFMKSVLVVWSVLGCTVAFLIAFILPAAFWHKLVGPHAKQAKRYTVVVLLVGYIALGLVCSALTAMRLDAPPCPVAPVAVAATTVPTLPPAAGGDRAETPQRKGHVNATSYAATRWQREAGTTSLPEEAGTRGLRIRPPQRRAS